LTVLLGIDIGTTHLKVAAFDEAAGLISLKKAATRICYDDKGWGYYQADEIWNEIAGLIKQISIELDGTGVDTVSVASMGETIVPIDASGNVCFDAIAWFDVRARPQAESAGKRLGSEIFFRITGHEPNPVFPLFKILWIRENHPKIYAKAQKWLQMADYIYWCLCREYATDYTLASRTLAMNINRCQWSDEIIKRFNLKTGLFPPMIQSGTPVGRITLDASRKTGLLEGTPVVVGGHDHQCATLAAGIKPGENVLDSSGTAESFLFVSETGASVPPKNEGLRVCRYLDPSNYVSWGGIISSGDSVNWAVNLLLADIPDANSRYEAITERTTALPKSGALLFLPHLRGSGAPSWNPEDKGAFLGIRSNHSQSDLLGAVFTGLSFQTRMIIELQQTVSKSSIKRIRTVGGGSTIPAWQQIKADVTAKIVEIPAIEEATLLGAAILAGVGISVYENIYNGPDRVHQIKARYFPNPENTGYYERLFTVYKEASAQVSAISKKLDAVF
jgi:sugar (pentulose or hexulose) kinase